MATELENTLETLRGGLESIGRAAVAVSGGVDSMTLAVVAGRLGTEFEVFHARSPAVPPAATLRVHRYARREGWRLHVVDAQEFADPQYMANPANRCFYCKTHLYATIRRATDALVLSGTNVDDLGDYRPGLQAARAHDVRHPFVEAGIDKATVRSIARRLELNDLAELPAAPCLSSRIETGIGIERGALRLVDAVERFIAAELRPETVRCRIRRGGVVIELDATGLAALSTPRRGALSRAVAGLCRDAGIAGPVRFEAYRMGSAFLRPPPSSP